MMGRALVDVAVETGCDAVKFQTYRSETVYVEDAGESNYLAAVGIRRSINQIFDDLAMPYELVEQLAAYAGERGIRFMSTPFSPDDVDAVDPFVMLHKIASYEISHTTLLAHVARKGKPVIISSGASTLDDIEFALDHLRDHGAPQVAVLQCTAKYPTPLAMVNTRVVETLRNRFGVPVGLSDHSREPTAAPAAAVALGASIIEKHYTLDNRLPGPDHSFALTPSELGAMVRAVRDIEACLGDDRKDVGEAERELAEFARRGLQATRTINVGDALALGDNVEILRPGNKRLGLHPRYLPKIEGRRARRRVVLGDGIDWDDFDDG